MTLPELQKFAWMIHPSLFAIGLAAWYKYSLKDDLEALWKKELQSIRYDLLQLFARKLQQKISPAFQNLRPPEITASAIIDQAGQPAGFVLDYSKQQVKEIVESEEFRDVLVEFFLDYPKIVLDFRILKIELPKSIGLLSRTLQTCIISLIISQIVAFGISKMCGEGSIYVMFLITAIIVVLIIYAAIRLFMQRCQITRLRDCYEKC